MSDFKKDTERKLFNIARPNRPKEAKSTKKASKTKSYIKKSPPSNHMGHMLQNYSNSKAGKIIGDDDNVNDSIDESPGKLAAINATAINIAHNDMDHLTKSQSEKSLANKFLSRTHKLNNTQLGNRYSNTSTFKKKENKQYVYDQKNA
jgi:hypothetical protein